MLNRSCRVALLVILVALLSFTLPRPVIQANTPLAPDTSAANTDQISDFIPLPGSCGRGLPVGATVPVCCMFGYVFIDGQAVAGVQVILTNQRTGDQTEVWTAMGPDSDQPYYGLSLSDAPLNAQEGDTITIVAEYSSHSRTITHAVLKGGQQVDVVLPRAQADDYVFERQIWRQAEPGKFNSPWGIAVDGSGMVYVVDQNNERVQVFNRHGQFVRQWGTLGDQPGQFADPLGIAVDQSGNVYVSDTGNARIQKFSSMGVWQASWGVRGNGNGQFQYPVGVSVDRNGNVYVVDNYNRRVEKFRADGLWLTGWGSPGNGNGQFSSPHGVSVDSNNNVYVADNSNHRIDKFRADGTWVASWGGPQHGSGSGQFWGPQGVSVDSNDNVYVTESGNERIQKLSSEGIPLASWGTSGSGNGQFYAPKGIGVDSSGNVYVADWGNHRIQKFNGSGGWQANWGREGIGNGQFVYPAGLAIDSSDHLYVADRGNSLIHKFSIDGTPLTSWGSPGSGNGQFYGPEGVSVDSQGNVYIADRGNHRIQKFTNDGTWLATWGGPNSGSGRGQFYGPEGVSVDGNDNVYVADTGNHRIQKFTSEGIWLLSWGRLGNSNGRFNGPAAVSVDSTGNVYVADRDNHRIQKFTKDGTWLATWGGPNSGSGSGQFYAPEGVYADSNGDVYVADSGNHRIQRFSSAGRWLASWGSHGSSNGQFDTPHAISRDSSGDIYVVEWGHHRIQVFRPMTYHRPIATVVAISDRSVSQGQSITFVGSGSDSDETATIAAYEWALDGTPFATTPLATLATAGLSLGVHTVTFSVQDTEGQVSAAQTVTIDITSDPRPTTWTFLLYLAGDNGGLTPFLSRTSPLGVLYRLEHSPPNPFVNVVALYDGDRLGGGDTYRYVLRSNGQFTEEAVPEANMGDPQTLISFVQWGKQQAPASHYYLAIADHANALDGIAWDLTADSQGHERLSNAELRDALVTITENGAHPIDVLHLDGCLMGLLEIAHQVRELANYLVASENLGWSAFAYDAYRAAIGPQSSERTVALAVTDRYAQRVGQNANPYTITALDLSQVNDIALKTDLLARKLLVYALANADNRTTLANLRTQAQKLDSSGNLAITNDDEYLDLYHWASLIQTGVNSSTIQSAAASLQSAWPTFVIREHHGSGSYGGVPINLDQTHGVGIYYPPQPSVTTYQVYVQGELNFPTDTWWDEFLAAALAPLPIDPRDSKPNPVAPLHAPPYRTLLPIIRR